MYGCLMPHSTIFPLYHNGHFIYRGNQITLKKPPPSKLMPHNIVKPVNKGHSREPDNVALKSSYPLYTGKNYAHYL